MTKCRCLAAVTDISCECEPALAASPPKVESDETEYLMAGKNGERLRAAIASFPVETATPVESGVVAALSHGCDCMESEGSDTITVDLPEMRALLALATSKEPTEAMIGHGVQALVQTLDLSDGTLDELEASGSLKLAAVTVHSAMCAAQVGG